MPCLISTRLAAWGGHSELSDVLQSTGTHLEPMHMCIDVLACCSLLPLQFLELLLTPNAATTHHVYTCRVMLVSGELGWLERGTFFPEFEAAAFSAAVGGITRATTPRGHHLIRVDNEK